MQELRDSNKAEGQDRIYTHGEKEFESKKNVIANGIPVNEKTYAEMEMIAEFTGAKSLLPKPLA
jgi:LDH2 family malate/lactate/ureidoglycolate dehydrogenase